MHHARAWLPGPGEEEGFEAEGPWAAIRMTAGSGREYARKVGTHWLMHAGQ
jgi:hypothetical protein